MMRKEFLEEIDSRLPQLGYSDRASFIRDSLYSELERHGIRLPVVLKTAPSRKGKGGRRPKVVPIQDTKVAETPTEYKTGK